MNQHVNIEKYPNALPNMLHHPAIPLSQPMTESPHIPLAVKGNSLLVFGEMGSSEIAKYNGISQEMIFFCLMSLEFCAPVG